MDGRTTPENAEYYRHHYQCSFELHTGTLYPEGMTQQPPPSGGSATTTGSPSDTLPPHLRFLEKVHGYTAPPSVWRLSQLAAMLGGHTGTGGTTTPTERARDLVELAALIWDAAAVKRQEIQRAMDGTLEGFGSRSLLYGPLKAGIHFMPRIDWQGEEEVIPFRRFLEQVIGLTREEDRMHWWRAYLTTKIRRDRHRDRWGAFATEANVSHPDWCEPDDFPIDEMLVADAMALQQREGFHQGFPARHYAEGFRLWRLQMKTPEQRADRPLHVEKSAEKALEGK